MGHRRLIGERLHPPPSLALGSRRPLVGLFKSSSAAFQIGAGEAEAQKIAAPNRDNLVELAPASQAPCLQRSQRSLRVLLQSEHRLLGQALGLGDDR
jgi:hypothetical protein